MRRLLLALSLITLTSCGGDDSPPVIDPADIRMEIVSGDGQVARVASFGPGNRAGLVATETQVEYDILPDPLVVRLTDPDGDPLSTAQVSTEGVTLVEPTLGAASKAPPGTSVGFHVLEEGCGSPFVGSGVPDDSAVVQERWIKGTKAGECHMEARGIVDGEPIVHETFTWTALPGPMVGFRLLSEFTGGLPVDYVVAGDVVDLRGWVSHGTDEHGNEVPLDSILAYPDAAVSWEWRTNVGNVNEDPRVSGTGWAATVPDLEAEGFPRIGDRVEYPLQLWLTLDGVQSGNRATVDGYMEPPGS